MAPTVLELLQNHISLSISCIDRLYINGYVPKLQQPWDLRRFLEQHRGNTFLSPALLKPMSEGLRREVKALEKQGIPIVAFERRQRKDEVAAGLHREFEHPSGLVFVGVAQERQSAFGARKVQQTGRIDFEWSRQSSYVNQYYYYILDEQWGPAFIKVGSYLPYPVKLCLNGHEWAKRQLRADGIAFEALDNGFLSCDDPERLQEICDRLSAEDVTDFFNRWSWRLPWPLTPEDRDAGYDHNLSIWQMEVSLTQVFERPVQGRHFFNQIIRDNLDLGAPERVQLLFPKKTIRSTPAPRRGYNTRVITAGVSPSLHVEHRSSHVKQYFKEERALRTETTINDTKDFGSNKSIENLEFLRDHGEQVNRKLLEAERVSQNCVLTQAALDRLQSSTFEDGKRASALRFGEERVMALMYCLCLFFHLPFGFRNRDIRPRVASLLGLTLDDYSANRMTYDLRRLRLKGLIHRIPGSNRYTVTTEGLRVAYFYAKVHLRILRPGFAALLEPDDPIPRPLRSAMAALDREIAKVCDDARIRAAG